MRRAWTLWAALGLAARLTAGEGAGGFDFLTLPAGARSAAMGETGVALADDAASQAANPAALARVRAPEASLTYGSLPAGLAQAAFSYAHPGRRGGWGFQALALDYGDIPAYDGDGLRGGSYNARDLGLGVGAARTFGGAVSAGVALKQARQTIRDASASAWLADAGLCLHPSRGRWSAFQAGVALRHLGGEARFKSEGAPAPRTLDVGVRWKGFSDAWLVTVENSRGRDGASHWSAGQELWAYNTLAVRAGWRGGRDIGTGLTFGVGVKVRDFSVDYSFSGGGKAFQDMHRAGLSWRFGGRAETLYQEGLTLSQKGDWAEAIMRYKEALDVNARHREAQRAMKEALRQLQAERAGRER